MKSDVRKAMLAGLLALSASGAAAVPADESELVEIELSNFAFAPADLHLRTGRAYRLHFVNRGSGGHNFSAPAFFAAAQIDPRDSAAVARGAVDLAKGEAREVRLVPTAGHYPVRCTHFLHSTFGMKGSITVD